MCYATAHRCPVSQWAAAASRKGGRRYAGYLGINLVGTLFAATFATASDVARSSSQLIVLRASKE